MTISEIVSIIIAVFVMGVIAWMCCCIATILTFGLMELYEWIVNKIKEIMNG